MDTLTVRLYNVLFGDAILVSIPDRDENDQPLTRHILIDVGNVHSGEGGKNEVFKPALEDILRVLDGQPLDLYVMSHEHMDHVQGLLWAEKHAFDGQSLKTRLNVQHAWFPASAAENYYETHAEAKKKLDEATQKYLAINRFLTARDEPVPDWIQVLMRNNNRFLGGASNGHALSHGRTADCVEYARSLAGDNTHYLYRSVGQGGDLCDLSGKHNFRETQFEIWAPEENSADYYGRFQPMALGATDVAPNAPGSEESISDPVPPAGVDGGAFYNLLALRKRGYLDNLLAIDKAANNSSLVFCIKWRGWKLLFPGDAEIRSWKEMGKEGALSAVHFLKVSHHGSHNGTPDGELLHKIFPAQPPDDKLRSAAVSTCLDTYSGIPHEDTFRDLEDSYGCSIVSTLTDIPDGEMAVKVEFKG